MTTENNETSLALREVLKRRCEADMHALAEYLKTQNKDFKKKARALLTKSFAVLEDDKAEIPEIVSLLRDNDALTASDDQGYFSLISLKIRSAVVIRAVHRNANAYFLRCEAFADSFAAFVFEKNERFLKLFGMTLNPEDDEESPFDTYKGYDDALIPDMPDRNLVLHPRKKKYRP